MLIFFFYFNLFLESKEFLEKNKTMICCKKRKEITRKFFKIAVITEAWRASWLNLAFGTKMAH